MIREGYTAQVSSDLTCSESDGSCWSESCDQYGTPGAPPPQNCKTGCNNERCQANGDNDATCIILNGENECQCSQYYYFDGTSCRFCYVFCV